MTQYTLGIHDYWRIIRRKKLVIIFVSAATIFATYIYTDMQTPLYRAVAEVKVETPKAIPGVAVDQSGWDMYMALNTEVKVIKSAVVAERTARKIGMLDDKMTESQKQAIIASFQNMVDAERIGDSNLIRITAVASDPRLTAVIANATADTYIEKGVEDRSRRARELKDFIEKQMEEALNNLKKSEDVLRSFTEASGAKGTGGLLGSRLVELETRKSELLKKFTEQHPEVKRLSDQISAVEGQMKHLPKEELEYARLSREVKINEELYTLLAKRYKEAEIAEADRGEQTASIVTPAVEPGRPLRPNKTANVAVGAFTGVFLGFLLALFFENLDTSIGTIEDVEHFLETPVIGIIPHELPTKLKTSKKSDKIAAQRSLMIIFHSGKSPFVEAYHTMRTNLQFTAFREKGNILNFTSAGVSEGKTITAINFALAAAQSGTKTVLVEMDLRRPLLHKILGLPRIPGITDGVIGKPLAEIVKGTADLMLGELSVERIIDVPGIENLKIVTCGEIPTNPIDFLNSQATRGFLKALSQNYELVILDCPPVLLFADPLIISSMSDATILVYQVGKMSRTALKRAKDQLASVKANLVGVALNDIKASDMQHRYGYYYTYKYYHKG